MSTLSIVIPAYREEQRLPPTLEKIAAWVAQHPELSVDVLVVDDGSADATAARAEERGPALGLATTVLRLPQNRGKGAAVRAGALAATGERILVSDADLSTPIEEFAKLAVSRADVAIGSRAVDESLVKDPQPLYRRAAGKLFNRLVQLLAVPGVRDTQCGFKLFSRDAAHAIFALTTIDRFAWDVEALLLARKLGFSIEEVPVLWFNSDDSRVGLGGGAQAYADLLKVRFRVARALQGRTSRTSPVPPASVPGPRQGA